MSILEIVLTIILAAAVLSVLVIAWLRASARRAALILRDPLEDMPNALIGDWCGIAFAVLGVLAFGAAFFSVAEKPPLPEQSRVVVWFGSGVLIAAMGTLFLVLSNKRRALILAQLERADRGRDVTRGLQLAEMLPKEDDLKRRLYVALALQLAGARTSNPAVPQILLTRSWRPVCAARPLFRSRMRKRRRSSRR